MAEEDGYAVMEDLDLDWLYVEDDYPLSVRIGHVLLCLEHLHVSAHYPLPRSYDLASHRSPTIHEGGRHC